MTAVASPPVNQLTANQAGPRRDWKWSQAWENVLFLHWPVEDGPLVGQLPAGLEIDRWEGSAWVSIVAFRLANVRLHPYVIILGARPALTDPEGDGRYVLQRIWKSCPPDSADAVCSDLDYLP